MTISRLGRTLTGIPDSRDAYNHPGLVVRNNSQVCWSARKPPAASGSSALAAESPERNIVPATLINRTGGETDYFLNPPIADCKSSSAPEAPKESIFEEAIIAISPISNKKPPLFKIGPKQGWPFAKSMGLSRQPIPQNRDCKGTFCSKYRWSVRRFFPVLQSIHRISSKILQHQIGFGTVTRFVCFQRDFEAS